MARRRLPPQREPVPPTLPSTRALELLRQQLARIDEVQQMSYDDPAVKKWELTTTNILHGAFGKPDGEMHDNTKEFTYCFGGAIYVDMPPHELQQNHVEQTQSRKAILESLIEQLEIFASPVAQAESSQSPEVHGNRVFLVHGHDEAVLQATARFLERLNLPVIILREQPNEGRTIIEKFVDYSDVGFAVVLLTPDDRGGAVSAPYEDQTPRARQNVILELGYFLGKLGRRRVGALYREGVEIPSDYKGVLFVEFDDAGAWRMELAREMKAAGLQIDMNPAVRRADS